MADRQDRLNLLTVDDDPGIVRELEAAVGDSLLNFQFADTQNAISRTLEEGRVDLGIIHVHSGSQPMVEPLARALRALDPPAPLIALVDMDPDSAAAAAQHAPEGIARSDDPRSAARLIRDRVAQIRTAREQSGALHRVSDLQERYNLLLESSREAIAYLHEGLHIYANPSYLARFGYDSFEDLEGFSILDLLTSAYDGTDLKTLLKSLAKGEIPDAPLDVQAVKADGEEFRARADFSPATYEGEACTQIMVREKLEQGNSEALKKELEKLRSTDMLTGLLNRPAFIRHLQDDIQSADENLHTAVLLVSLDDYAGLQRRVGAAASDQVIKQTAGLFVEAVDDSMLPTRLSDNVLAVRQQVEERGDAVTLATHLVEHFSGKILEIGGKSPTVTVSAGIALGAGQMFTADELLAQALTALHEAERTGGNCYVRYRPSADTGDSDELAQWSERLKHALNNKEFKLVRMPITSMEDDEFQILDVECRLRTEGSDEVILPSTFRPAAAKAGLATDLDRDLVEQLLAAELDNNAQVMLPISLASLTDESFVDWLQSKIEEGALPGNQLIIGVQESEIQESLREVQRFITRFSARGVRFALLGVRLDSKVDLLLKNLSFDFLKIEDNLSGAFGRDETAKAALASLAQEAKDHAFEIIAPKVENTTDLAALWQYGITLVQDDFVRD